MIIAFFESIKYVGHLFPLAFLRVFIGYYFLNQALLKYQGDFLTHPRLADLVASGLAKMSLSGWYVSFLENVAIPQWRALAGLVVLFEFLIGASFILGYLVRPMALLGVILSSFYLTLLPEHNVLYKTLVAIFVTMAWLAAGRCMGFDYYFYKRNRGIWW